MKYERLTKKDWHETKLSRVSEYEPSDKVILKQLWELENKIENGTLIELPCKVGDTVYAIEEDSIEEYEVLGVLIQDEFFVKLFRKRDFVCKFWGSRSVFLTREEAEAKLKGQHNEELF